MDSAGQFNNNSMASTASVSGGSAGAGGDDADMFNDADPRNAPQVDQPPVEDVDQPPTPEIAADDPVDARQSRRYHRVLRNLSVVLRASQSNPDPPRQLVQQDVFDNVAVDLARMVDNMRDDLLNHDEPLPIVNATSPIVVSDASPARTPNSGSARKRAR